MHLKGFRPGHAPRKMLERLFGDQIRGEVIQKLIKESTGKALREHHLTPVAEPEIVTEETDLKKRCASPRYSTSSPKSRSRTTRTQGPAPGR